MRDLTNLPLEKLAGLNEACACGETHAVATRRILFAPGAYGALADTLGELFPAGKVLLVTCEDVAQLAQPAVEQLRRAGYEVLQHVYPARFCPGLVAAGELLNYPEDVRALVAVGSGSVTDAVRYSASVLGTEYVVLPTAPSTTAYLADSSLLYVGGVLRRFEAKAPYAVLADTDALCRAPRTLMAAGFGELMSVHAALFDWYFAYAVNGEPYCQDLAEAVRAAVSRGSAAGEGLGRGAPADVLALSEALLKVSLLSQAAGARAVAGGVQHAAAVLSAMSRRAGRHGRLYGEYCYLAGLRLTELYRYFCDNPVYDLALPPDKGLRAARAAELLGAEEYAFLSDALARDESGYEMKQYRLTEYRDDLAALAAEAYGAMRGAEKSFRRIYEDLGYAVQHSVRPQDLMRAAALAPDTDSGFTALAFLRDAGLTDACLK